MNDQILEQRRLFGRLLKGVRNRSKMTLMNLQQRTGIKYSAIAAMELGTRAAGDHLAEKLADGLKLKGQERAEFLIKAASTRISDRLTKGSKNLSPAITHYVGLMLDGMGIRQDQIVDASITTSIPQEGATKLKRLFTERCATIAKSIEEQALSEPLLTLTLKNSKTITCTLLTAEVSS